MKQSLPEFKDQFGNLVLNFLWRQWSALGVAGSSESDDDWIIDPEALLIFTCFMGRHDARLFDEVIDWMHKNGEFVNVQRLKRILKTETFTGQRTLAVIASLLSEGEHALKWKGLADTPPRSAENESLFYYGNGEPMPMWGAADLRFEAYGFLRGPMKLRGYSMRFRPTTKTNLLLQLRSLFGITARSDVIAYLLTHDNAHPSEVARETYYGRRAVQNTLVDMASSGVVRIKMSGKVKHYWVKPEPWVQLLDREDRIPAWVTWPPLFSALESIWIALNDGKLMDKTDPLFIASELRQLMVRVQPLLEKAGFEALLSDDRQYRGEEYYEVFLSDIRRLLG